jgi:hypothetical protein
VGAAARTNTNEVGRPGDMEWDTCTGLNGGAVGDFVYVSVSVSVKLVVSFHWVSV